MKLGIRELVFVLLMIGLGACSYLFVLKPSAEKRTAQESEMAAKRKALNDLRQSTADISNLEKKITELQQAIRFFESKLPQDKDIDKILQEVWQMADVNALQTRTIKTLKSERSAGYSEQPIQISLAGDFKGFYKFLLQLEKLSRITRLSSMKLDKITGKDGEMQAQMTLSIFFESDGSGTKLAGTN